jgi:hypothetical protein
VPGETTPGGSGKAKCHTPDPPAVEKSDALILPAKPSNKGDQPAEMVEGRSAAKGNADQLRRDVMHERRELQPPIVLNPFDSR